MTDPSTIVVAVGTVFNTGLLTGIFYRLGSLGARLNTVEKHQEFQRSKS